MARADLVRAAIYADPLGRIEWSDSCLRRFLDDPEMSGFKSRGINNLLRAHIRKSASEPRVAQEDPDRLKERPDDPWVYITLIPVPEFKEGLFVKMKLIWDEEEDSEDDAFAQLVSVHKGRPRGV